MNNQEFTKKYYINRSKANSIKWSMANKEKALPMWIADMDFKDDERIIKALNDFISFGDFGYTNLPGDYLDVFVKWHKDRNGITYNKDAIRFTKGAVDAMYQLLYALTAKGDAVMINTPLYPPFKQTIQTTDRKVIESKLINTGGYFTFDYKDIERKFKTKRVKALMLCSPHNPLGRVWKKGELEELLDLCKKYKVLVVVDEVHSDIIMPDQEFIPALAFKKYQDIVVSIIAASKTFSLAVFSHCHVVIPNNKLRDKFDKYQKTNHLASVNAFNGLATYYGYKYGSEWLDTLNNVVFENYNYIKKHLSPYFDMTTLEGTYLLFLDLAKCNTCESAAKLLREKAHLIVNAGETFDAEYNNWVRINLATSLTNIKKATRAIKECYDLH